MKSFCFLIFFAPMVLFAQNDVASLLSQGAALEKQLKEPEALEKYKEVLKKDPNNLTALTSASFLSSKIGVRSSGDTKVKLYNDAREYGERAVKIAPNDAEANYVMGVAMGRIAEFSDTKQKIEYSKDVKKYAEAALEADKTHAGAWHLLGKWNHGVKDLGATKLLIIKTIYGGLPKASFETAIECYNKAIKYDSDYILYYLDLAKSYEKLGQKDYAKAVLKKAMALTPKYVDDPKYLAECRQMYSNLN